MQINRKFRMTFFGTLAAAAIFTINQPEAFAQGTPANPPSGWQVYGQTIHLTTAYGGATPNPLWGVNSEDQVMTSDLYLTTYKTAQPVGDGYDYYLVAGSFRHAVQGYSDNWASVGYYATSMQLSISGNGAELFDFGPNSTVKDSTTGFTVGGSIGMEGKSPTGDGSFSFSESFSSPDVTFSTTAAGDTLHVITDLPGVGFKSPGVPANPEAPSSSGYSYDVAAVYRVPSGRGLKLSINDGVRWEFDYTRGIAYDVVNTEATGVYNVDFAGKQLRQSSNCMDVRGGVAASGTPVIEWPCGTQENQKWSYTAASQLMSNIPSVTPFCLDALSNSSVVLNVCDSTKASQKFSLGYSDGPYGLLPSIQRIDGQNVQASSKGSQLTIGFPDGRTDQLWVVY